MSGRTRANHRQGRRTPLRSEADGVSERMRANHQHSIRTPLRSEADG